MSFAEDVKNELCQYESSSDADLAMKIEASCLLRMGGSRVLLVLDWLLQIMQ